MCETSAGSALLVVSLCGAFYSEPPDVVTLSALATQVIVPIGMEPLTLSEALLPMMVKLQRTSASEQIEQFKSSMLEPSANTVS